jgi:arylsulfotransferase ASST
VNRAEFLARSVAFVLSAQTQPRYVSRPDLDPPVVRVLHRGQGLAPGYLFLAPSSGPGQHGPLVLDNAGEPVWFRPTGLPAMNFRAQTLDGEPVLTWWQALPGGGLGRGEHVIVNASYREIARFPAGNGRRSDLHEFLLTDRGTALVTSFEVRNHGKGLVMGGVVQELEVPSARVLFEWRSLDHVALMESYTPVGYPADYFHVNSIDVDVDGNLLVSARNTWAVYKVNRRTGTVMWRLGGKRSDFALGKGARFAWQHDARSHDAGRTVSVFDNGETRSRGLVLALDVKRMRASVVHEYPHEPPLHAHKLGSVQLLEHGDVLVGWGTDPHFTEYAAGGAVVLDATLPHGGENYRTLRSPWNGHPRDEPAAVVKGSTVYASWNGATEVAAWRVEPGGPRIVRTGFETALPLREGTVVALDARGRPLGSYRLR